MKKRSESSDLFSFFRPQPAKPGQEPGFRGRPGLFPSAAPDETRARAAEGCGPAGSGEPQGRRPISATRTAAP